ncbi:hypothetical protein HanIR_Chr10g0468511 [Helianthus annuus]|nr:hypothetical protein HanIR_Chr10g0468511 [Helianthus annuus]
MQLIKADLPTFGTPTTITRRVGSFAIFSFSLSSTSSRSYFYQLKTQVRPL